MRAITVCNNRDLVTEVVGLHNEWADLLVGFSNWASPPWTWQHKPDDVELTIPYTRIRSRFHSRIFSSGDDTKMREFLCHE